MNTMHLSRITALGASAMLAAAAAIGAAGPVLANDVIAVDAAAVPAAATGVPTAVASRPGTIVVTRHGGRSVTLFAKGERIRRVLAPGRRPATFTGLTAGRVYTVAIGGQPIGAVVALNAPTAASGLTVRTTDTPGTVTLTWRHRPSAATGGRAIRYDVRATSRTAPPVTATVTGALSTRLTGLATDAVYTFRVTPRNTAGAGRSTTAVMTRTLAQASSRPAASPVAEAPAPTQPPVAVTPVAVTPAPAPAPAPGPAPAPTPAPATKTIWVCPEGFTEVGNLCQKTAAYTYDTTPYTYHVDFIQTGTHVEYSTSPNGGTYYPAGQPQWNFGAAGYYKVVTDGYEVIVKDPKPAGYTDTGTEYTKLDPAPAGYLDDGTQWVLTVAKISKVVPA
jgi:hypothetical protein